MNEFDIPVDEDYADAPEQMLFEEDVFDDVDAAVVEEEFDIDDAVDILYNAIYGDE
jgi:hypothetical protein